MSASPAVPEVTGNLMKLHRMEPIHIRMNATIAKMDAKPDRPRLLYEIHGHDR